MKLLPRFNFHSHQAAHRRSVGLQMRSLRNDKFTRRLSSKLNDIAEEYDAEEMTLGLIIGLSQQALKGFNQQLDNASLPNFMRDELRNTFKDLCATTDHKVSVQCQIECNAVFEAFLPLATQEGKSATGDIKSAPIETDEQPLNPTPEQAIRPNWSWHRTLSFIYEKMIFLRVKTNPNQEADEKTLNWLALISRSIASLQCKFLQAAMDNLRTMQENIGFPYKSQDTLNAMSDEARARYHCQCNEMHKRFISAQSHYRANLHLFSLTTQMLTSLFSLFSTPCRFRST